MKLKLIACKVLTRELSLLAAGSEHYIDITYIRQGYHDTPDKLRRILQEEIDRVDSGDDRYSADSFSIGEFDAILLGYGLCGNGIVGLTSGKYKIVIPRGHDCITFFLGSKERYQTEFDLYKGNYWYTPGWIENTPMPSHLWEEHLFRTYAKKHKEDKARRLVELEKSSLLDYRFATYVEWENLQFPAHQKFTEKAAEYFGWEYRRVTGNMSLLTDFINGNWDEERFLILEPGKTVEASYDENVIESGD